MPTNFSNCGNCPYSPNSSKPSSPPPSLLFPPLDIDYGNQANELLIFQAPGDYEWNGKTMSTLRKPLDSIKPASAAGRMRNSFCRKGTQRSDYDITEAVACFPGKTAKGRDKRPCASARTNCVQYLCSILQAKQYTRIVCFGYIAYSSVVSAIAKINSWTGPTPTLAKHPSGGVSNFVLDTSY